jgi:hypothetical protein
MPVPRAPRVGAPGKSLAGRAEELVRRIEELKARIGQSFYDMGAMLAELSAPSMYGALGFGSFEELLAARRLTSRMSALRLIEVARAFPREMALELGVEKAYALVRYAAATPAADVARELARVDAPIAGKRVRSASTREILAATRRLRGKGSREVQAASPEVRRLARALQAALRKAGAKGARASGEQRDGAGWIVVRIPAGEVGRVEVTAA